MKMTKMPRFRQGGFTLLELLIVMAIIGVIASISLSAYYSIGQGARVRGTVNTLQSTIALVRQRAIMQQRPLSIVFSNVVDSGTVTYEVRDDAGKRIGDRMHTPRGVTVGVNTGDEIRFTPSGVGDFSTFPIEVQEVGTTANKQTLTVYGLTGLVRVDTGE